MRAESSRCRRVLLAIAVAVLLVPAVPGSSRSDDFEDTLARVDRALRQNPSKVSEAALMSCQRRRLYASQLYYSGDQARAERGVRYCFELLQISDKPRKRAPQVNSADQAIAKIRARAARELEQALTLTPDIKNGLEIYRGCAECHMPEGFGLSSGLVPQLAGQHKKVVIKQLADTRAGNRDNVLMAPYASVESIGGAQSVADVAGYIDTLEISVDTGKGAGDDLGLGERLYGENCAECHGATGEGNDEKYVPRIQAQHYKYMLKQFQWIKDGRRRNANSDMVAQIQSFEERETRAVLDYVSRLEPPPEFQAPSGWRNPDFIE